MKNNRSGTKINSRSNSRSWAVLLTGSVFVLFFSACMPNQTGSYSSSPTAFPDDSFILTPVTNGLPIKAPVQDGGQDPGGGKFVTASDEEVVTAIDLAWNMATSKKNRVNIFSSFAQLQVFKAKTLSEPVTNSDELLKRKLRASSNRKIGGAPHPLLKRNFDAIVKTFQISGDFDEATLLRSRNALINRNSMNQTLTSDISVAEENDPLVVEHDFDFDFWTTFRSIGDRNSKFAQFLNQSTLHKELNSSCSGRDHKSQQHFDASVSDFKKGSAICISVLELKKYPKEALLQQVLGLLAHEAAHLNGYGEETAQEIQTIFLDFLPTSLSLPGLKKIKEDYLDELNYFLAMIDDFELRYQSLIQKNKVGAAQLQAKIFAEKLGINFRAAINLLGFSPVEKMIFLMKENEREKALKLGGLLVGQTHYLPEGPSEVILAVLQDMKKTILQLQNVAETGIISL